MARRFEEVLTEQLRDPTIRSEWERTALARAVAVSVIRYRATQRLTQRQLAERLGWKQAQIARLEIGEHTPTLDTLMHLSQVLGIEFLVDIRPAQSPESCWITAEVEHADVFEAFATADGGRVLIAAG